MFIRWQKRDLVFGRHYRANSSISWRAVLVEAVRVDGNPVPRHIAYLSSIGDAEIADPGKRRRFWEDALANIDKFHVRVEEREKLIAALARKVPRE
jgi:hypothetical protein